MGAATPWTARVAASAAKAAAAALVLAGCATSSGVEVVPVAPAPTATAPPEPTATSGPTATATPTATPTPTPTPRPAQIVPTDVLQQSIAANFAYLDQSGLAYSYAVHVDGFGYVDERGADVELLPASNQKLVTAVGALELLPADFRFRTEVRLDDAGNVYLVAGGDPTLKRSHISAMADDLLRRLSVELADGEPVQVRDVVVDPSHFPPTRIGPGWPDRYIPVDVGPMSGFMLDDNLHRGDAAYLADPDRGNAELVARLLGDAGIGVTGTPRVGPVDPVAALVATRTSPSLISLVDTILGQSDNEVADALVRQIGLVHAGEGEIPAGQAVIYQRVAELGVDLGEPAGDGSGLSRLNSLSARELVELLLMARERPWWPTIANGLADAGTDGTLAERLDTDTTIGNVRAKTGSLADVVALSGLLTTVDGAEVVFSFLINGRLDDPGTELTDPLDQIVVALASATVPQLTG